MLLMARNSKRHKTEPEHPSDSLGEVWIRRARSDYVTAVEEEASRHTTHRQSVDPEFLEELQRRREEYVKQKKSVAGQCHVLSESDLEEAFGHEGSFVVRGEPPSDGWIWSAYEEPYTERAWTFLPEDGGSLHQEGICNESTLAKTWGIAIASCKGCKSIGDTTVGQDNFAAAQLSCGWKALCVFDGHGINGHWPALRAAQTMPYFLQQAQCAEALKRGHAAAALTTAFRNVQEEMEAAAVQEELDLHLCGATGTVALVAPGGKSVWVATVGDSRAMLFDSHSKTVYQTSDHKASREDEAARVKQAGGKVIISEYADGTRDYRVAPKDLSSPQIAVSRSLGDLIFKDSGVIAVPEIVEWQVAKPSEAYLLVCSDGVWEFLTTMDLRYLTLEALQSEGASATEVVRGLLQRAKQSWNDQEEFYCDDITVVLASLSGGLPALLRAPKESCPGCKQGSCPMQ
ncbi:unnamed protein product [Symbiodinium natans]|uniref:PPM-type phosphatase domain-containing protein n=1 Tax=Symbiodinium natans TaxID=878477 RepID=A0A812UD50_9DINO|nr:unnamed protein product [Symbiodinium natans]